MNKLIRTFLFIKHSLKPTWRLLNGRFFVFKDAPSWVVDEVANYENDADDDFQRIITAAREERRLRNWNRDV